MEMWPHIRAISGSDCQPTASLNRTVLALLHTLAAGGGGGPLWINPKLVPTPAPH